MDIFWKILQLGYYKAVGEKKASLLDSATLNYSSHHNLVALWLHHIHRPGLYFQDPSGLMCAFGHRDESRFPLSQRKFIYSKWSQSTLSVSVPGSTTFKYISTVSNRMCRGWNRARCNTRVTFA